MSQQGTIRVAIPGAGAALIYERDSMGRLCRLVCGERVYIEVVDGELQFGENLADHMAAADVFVFPSRTDTFGIVMLEAMACGVPVAALPVTGPIDVVRDGETGVLRDDLREAALGALHIDPAVCRAYASQRSWENATRQFIGNLVPALGEPGAQISPITLDN